MPLELPCLYCKQESLEITDECYFWFAFGETKSDEANTSQHWVTLFPLSTRFPLLLPVRSFGIRRRCRFYNECMSESDLPYDERYLPGIVCFNERDFFEAHEVWEDIWMDCTGPERRFYQALIQAAVALYHFRNGNLRGASKLYKSSRAYHEPYGASYLGL